MPVGYEKIKTTPTLWRGGLSRVSLQNKMFHELFVVSKCNSLCG